MSSGGGARAENVSNTPSTVTEFYGPSRSLPSQSNPDSTAHNTSRTPQAHQTSVWTLGVSREQPSTNGYRSNLPPPHPYLFSQARTNVNEVPVNKLSYPDPTRATPLSALSGLQTFVDCPHCKRRCLTRLEEENGAATMRRSAQMLVFCCFGALLPMIYKWDQDLVYYCMSCNKKLAVQEYSAQERGLQKVEVLWPEGMKEKAEENAQPSPSKGMKIGELASVAPGPKELPGGMHGDSNLNLELQGEPPIAELPGKSRADAEMVGTEAGKELEGGNEGPVFEMEHLNRGVGTQKRIRRNLGLGRKEQPPPLPKMASNQGPS